MPQTRFSPWRDDANIDVLASRYLFLKRPERSTDLTESRTYATQESCPVARTLNIVGDRWTILVLRDLSRGRRRYLELLQSLSGISTNLLADRLKRLEQSEMVEQVLYSDHPPRAEYCLTAKGRAFIPVLGALKSFGEEWEPPRAG
jgi:DNA-binding HxlR family transcriptional regulator